MPTASIQAVRTAAAGHLAQQLDDRFIVVAVIDHLGAAFVTRHLQSFGDPVNRNHPFGAQHVGALNREQPHRTTPPDSDGIPRADVADFSRHVAGGEDVRKEEHLLIGQVVGDLDRPHIGKGNAGVLSLPASIAAEEVGIAKEARGRVAIHLLRHPGIGVRVIAQRPEMLLAEEAVAAGDGKGHHNAVADLQIVNFGAYVHHLAHKLVAEDVPFLQRGDETVEEMQVRAADGGPCDFNYGVPRIQNNGIPDPLNSHVVWTMPT
jgi:hypothetical protein